MIYYTQISRAATLRSWDASRESLRNHLKGLRQVKRESKRTILIAGMGTSPAVLTETVWALAHQKNPVVPDKVVVITTTSGKEGVVKALLSGGVSVWQKLVNALRMEKIRVDGKLIFSEGLIEVMDDSEGEKLSDLRVGKDNLSAADFMLRVLRGYMTSDTTVLCSIAGGRKTMSALLFSCMTLLGRDDDKVFHVLIPPEYECGMEPPFYFPQKGVFHQLLSRGRPTGKKISSLKVAIELFEVPFVRMYGWYHDKFKDSPPFYSTLVKRMQSIAPPARTYPKVSIDAWNCEAWINGVKISLGSQEFAALVMLANGISNLDTMFQKFVKLAEGNRGADAPGWLDELEHDSVSGRNSKFCAYDESKWRDQNQEVSKIMNVLRTKLARVDQDVANSLVPKRNKAVTFPVADIVWVSKQKLMDICGYLFSGSEEWDLV